MAAPMFVYFLFFSQGCTTTFWAFSRFLRPCSVQYTPTDCLRALQFLIKPFGNICMQFSASKIRSLSRRRRYDTEPRLSLLFMQYTTLLGENCRSPPAVLVFFTFGESSPGVVSLFPCSAGDLWSLVVRESPTAVKPFDACFTSKSSP